MELLLNLCWLSLALPAYWLWRRERASATRPRSQHLATLSSVLIFGCMLMLLFPVVSATDDLHAMRPEVEESNPSKHIARQSDNNSPTAFSAVGGFPALLTTNSLFNAEYRAIGVISGRFHIIHIDIRIGLDSSRAPPSA